MNDGPKAAAAIQQFLADPSSRVCVVNGTNQNKKHQLVMAVLAQNREAVLFRINNLEYLSIYLGMAGKRIKTPMRLGNSVLHVDTFNPASWKKSPSQITCGVINPVDSIGPDKGSKFVHDLFDRQARKVILVTWTDGYSLQWADHFQPTYVTYDAEAENPELHDVMKANEASRGVAGSVSYGSLPSYASQTPKDLLINVYCHTCHAHRWSELNAPNPGQTSIKAAPHGDFKAKCLQCGTIADDNYNR